MKSNYICQSNKDLGLTIKAYVKSVNMNIEELSSRSGLTSYQLSNFFSKPDNESNVKANRIMAILDSIDCYLAFHVLRHGPYFPEQNNPNAYKDVIRYAMRIKGVPFEKLGQSMDSEIAYGKFKNIFYGQKEYSLKHLWSAYRALGITCYIMPKVVVGRTSVLIPLEK